MILKQWYDMLFVMSCNDNARKLITITGSNTGQMHSDSKYRGYDFNFGKHLGVIDTTGNGEGVYFGDGDTPPSFDDYKLSGTQIKTLTGTSTVSVENGDDYAIVTATFTLTNTGSSEVTIREVGLVSYYNVKAMLDRTVLDSPVTIPAGGVGQMTYTIRMDYPTE